MEFSEIMGRRTMAFSIATITFCRTMPREPECGVIKYQLLKSATSIGANYRLSCRGRSTREKRSKLGIALEEADESDYWLSLLEFIKMGDADQRKTLLAECGEFIKIFSKSLQTHRRKNPGTDAGNRPDAQ
jgi:four helix bundle protein